MMVNNASMLCMVKIILKSCDDDDDDEDDDDGNDDDDDDPESVGSSVEVQEWILKWTLSKGSAANARYLPSLYWTSWI